MNPITPAQNKRTLACNRTIPTPTHRVTRATSKTNAVKEAEPVSPEKKPTRRVPPNFTNTDKQQVITARSKGVEDGMTEKQPIKAFLRVRPHKPEGTTITKPYLIALSDTAVRMADPSPRSRQLNTESVYTFTKVFPPETHQSEFFTDVGLPLIRDLLNGQNGLLFAYGVTNSGKTYTIQGGNSKGSAGLLPRTLDVIFNSLDGLHSDALLRPVRLAGVEYDSDDNESARSSLTAVDLSSTRESVLADMVVDHSGWDDYDATVVHVDKDYEYSVWISYFEIYNEKVFSLLDSHSFDSANALPSQPRHYSVNGPSNTGLAGGLASSNSDSFLFKRKALALKNDPDGGKYIANLREIRVRTAEEAKAIVKLGQINRRVFGTLANHASSRSHSVFTIKLMKSRKDNPDIHAVQVSRLSIVDLAGSERVNNTQSSGERLKEAGNINKSLMVLGQCLEALRANQKKLALVSTPNNARLNVIPFRHSKLTEIFQDFFVGNGKAAMIVNINPYDTGFDENSNVMKFSALARDVHTATQKRPPPSAIPRFAPQTNHRKVTLSVGGGKGAKLTEKEVDIVEEEEDQDDEADWEPNNPLIEALFERVEELRIRLFEAEMRCVLTESAIREEVIQEMEGRMSQMERMYANRMRNELEENQLKIDRKIDMLRQAQFVTQEGHAVEESLSDIEEEMDIERSLIVETSGDESSQTSVDEHASSLARKRPLSHVVITEDSSGDLGLFSFAEEEETISSSSTSAEIGEKAWENEVEESSSRVLDAIPDSHSPTPDEDIESSSSVVIMEVRPVTPPTIKKTGEENTTLHDRVATVTKQRVSFDSLLNLGDDQSEDSVAIIPDKQARQKSIMYAGPDAEYVPREGEIDVPKKKKRILGKKNILTETDIAAFAEKANPTVDNGGSIRRLTRNSRKNS